jgi:hypothetical protein
MIDGETAQELNLYVPDGRAAILFYEDRSGGFCLVPSRRQIWHWNWVCPDPKTATVLYEEPDND